MIEGYAMHGHGKEALKHFEWMHEEGVQPDNVTFVGLLSEPVAMQVCWTKACTVMLQ
jgi:pentatricopeptide repeat protein